MIIEVPCDGAELELCRRRLANFAPPPIMSTNEWAKERRRFHRKDGARPGPFIPEPHQPEIMDAWDDPRVRGLVLIGCSQYTGKSAIMANIIGRAIDLEPVNMMVVHPTIKAAERWAKGRLEPMAEATECLHEKIPPRKARNGEQTILHRQYPGGQMFINGANAPTDLAAQTVRWAFFDETDRFEASAGHEGDPVELGIQRTVDYGEFAKWWMSSTPTIYGRSRIERAFEGSDQRIREAKCPKCGEFFEILWQHVLFTDPETGEKLAELAHIRCPLCEKPWTESDRRKAIRMARWRATAEFNGIAGFRINAFVCPRADLVSLARRFIAALGNPEQEQTFANTVEARSWRPKADAPPWESLWARRESYSAHALPDGVRCITAAADVQKDRLEVRVWGFGKGAECWHIETRPLLGPTNREEVWQELDKLLDETWQNASGSEFHLDRLAVDSGAFTEEVYAWGRKYRSSRRVMLVKGSKEQSAVVLGLPSKEEIGRRGKKAKYGLRVWPVGGAKAKQWLYQKLALPMPTENQEFPAGFVHLSTRVSSEEVKQLTSEELRSGKDRYGRPRMEWHVKPGHENHALDCWVYAYAAAIEWGLWRKSDAEWDRLAAEMIGPLKPSAPVAAATPAPSSGPAKIPSTIQASAPPSINPFTGRSRGSQFRR
jgi:phage terminase large subunit GpA-like protein